MGLSLGGVLNVLNPVNQVKTVVEGAKGLFDGATDLGSLPGDGNQAKQDAEKLLAQGQTLKADSNKVLMAKDELVKSALHLPVNAAKAYASGIKEGYQDGGILGAARHALTDLVAAPAEALGDIKEANADLAKALATTEQHNDAARAQMDKLGKSIAEVKGELGPVKALGLDVGDDAEKLIKDGNVALSKGKALSDTAADAIDDGQLVTKAIANPFDLGNLVDAAKAVKRLIPASKELQAGAKDFAPTSPLVKRLMAEKEAVTDGIDELKTAGKLAALGPLGLLV